MGRCRLALCTAGRGRWALSEVNQNGMSDQQGGALGRSDPPDPSANPIRLHVWSGLVPPQEGSMPSSSFFALYRLIAVLRSSSFSI
jgi:hypothetical protein